MTESVPPRVKFPEAVTVPVSVKPDTVPVPPTLVTVPTVLEVPAPIAVLKSAADNELTVLFALKRGKVIALGLLKLIRLEPMVVGTKLEFLINFPVVPSKTASALFVEEAGPTTAPSMLA